MITPRRLVTGERRHEDAAEAPVETPATPKELVVAIQSELGTITYTDNKGAFDQTMARVAALVSELIEARDEKHLLRFQKQLAAYELLTKDQAR